MKVVYIRNYQDKTCAIGPALELHNSNYMYSNVPRFYTARIPFLKPTWVLKTGGNVHTQNMLEARGALRRHKTKNSNGIGISIRTAIATRFLYVLIFFLVRRFEYDFVVR